MEPDDRRGQAQEIGPRHSRIATRSSFSSRGGGVETEKLDTSRTRSASARANADRPAPAVPDVQSSRSSSSMETTGTEQARPGGTRRVQFEDDCEARRQCASKTNVTRFPEQADIPESKKLKPSELVAIANGCSCAVASEIPRSWTRTSRWRARCELRRVSGGADILIPASGWSVVPLTDCRGPKRRRPVCRSFRRSRVDDPLKEKGRYVICEYAMYRGPTVFAAASQSMIGRDWGS